MQLKNVFVNTVILSSQGEQCYCLLECCEIKFQRGSISGRLLRFSFIECTVKWKHGGVPDSHWQCSYTSSTKLPHHMSRPAWFGWNSYTLKSWVAGHIAVAPHPSAHFHLDNGRGRGALQKRPSVCGGGEVGRRAVMWPRHVQPLHTDLTDLQVLKWKWHDIVVTRRHKHNMLDSLKYTWEHRCCM